MRRTTFFFLLLSVAAPAARADDSLATLRRARRTIAALADVQMAGRGYVHQGHVRAADYIARQLRRAGLRVHRQRFEFSGTMMAKVDSQWVPITVEQARTDNVIGVLRGRVQPDSGVLIGAHYDHLGQLSLRGRTHTFTGANDNASGVALMLELARRLRGFPYTVVVVAFSGEEAGLHGSTAYVRAPHPLPLAQVREMWNLDLVGFGERGLVVVNGMTTTRDTLPLARRLLAQPQAQALRPIQLRPNRANSDHWPFTQAGVPAAFVFTEGGPGHYHDVHDRAETLSLARFVALVRALEATLWAGRPGGSTR